MLKTLFHQGIQIQNDQISGQAGLYFDHVKDVWFTSYSWDVVTYVHLKHVQHLYHTLKQVIVTLEQECKAIKNFTLTYLRSRKIGVQRLKATLDDIIGPNNQQRRKRSVLPLVRVPGTFQY